MNDTSRGMTRSYVTHLECSATGERHDAGRLHGLSRARMPLLVRYDLEAVRSAVSRDALAKRPLDMWRFRELLPVMPGADIASLGEPATPLVRLSNLQGIAGVEVLVKDEGRLPTGTFKARGLAMAITMAKAFGVKRVAVPTSGNAGSAAAAYAARAGIEAFVFTPDDTDDITLREIGYHGAKVYRVNGFINHCAKIVREGAATMGWHDLSTLEEPYRVEGKKTMGLELAEQLGWDVPDAIFYPTGGGTGVVGMWKAFAELEAIGFIGSKRPRMVCVQSTGCAPIVRAAEAGKDRLEAPWENPTTTIHGFRSPGPIGAPLVLQAVHASGGFGVAVDDAAAYAARAEAAAKTGLNLCPEGGALLVACRQAIAQGRIKRGERVVLFNTASGLKYPMPPVTRRLDHAKAVDYEGL
ncbi:MAG: threonine synthase [Rhodospirillales bacterium]|nr:threonine synthase [Rhodospirillales bacterium]